jgi:hypothetical protein
LDWPLGQVLARTPDVSGLSAPGTLARAALGLGITETGRTDPASAVPAFGAQRAPGGGGGGGS